MVLLSWTLNSQQTCNGILAVIALLGMIIVLMTLNPKTTLLVVTITNMHHALRLASSPCAQLVQQSLAESKVEG